VERRGQRGDGQGPRPPEPAVCPRSRPAPAPERRRGDRVHGIASAPPSAVLSFPSISSKREARMPTLDRNGVTIHYEVHGNGPAVLLTHGYGATCRMWDGQIAAFKARYKVMVWDMRGHGQSAYPKETAAYSGALTVADRFSTPVARNEPSSAASRSAATCRSPFTPVTPNAPAR